MKLVDNFIIHYLKRFDACPFDVSLNGEKYHIGEGDAKFTVELKKPIPKSELLSSTTLALGEAYMRGDLVIDGDLFTALCSLLGQTDKFTFDMGVIGKFFNNPQTKKVQKEQVSSHYDLGNDFYSMWLDPSMSYSCAYFKTPEDSLEQAQHNKVHYILEKLHLQPGESLLDIGCGWGYLLIEAAQKYGITGMGITLSKEQWKKGQERIQEAGLEDKVKIELLDYRDLHHKGYKFDKIVSVGMLEHVGRDNYDKYMSVAAEVLKDGGLFLLHFISAQEGSLDNPWIRKYIFPGGMLPSLHEMVGIAYEKGFNIMDVESLRRHYEKTLLNWYSNFQKVKDKVAGQRGEEFVRMWDLYLCGCAAAFHIGNIDIDQMLLVKGINNDLPMTRWY